MPRADLFGADARDPRRATSPRAELARRAEREDRRVRHDGMVRACAGTTSPRGAVKAREGSRVNRWIFALGLMVLLFALVAPGAAFAGEMGAVPVKTVSCVEREAPTARVATGPHCGVRKKHKKKVRHHN